MRILFLFITGLVISTGLYAQQNDSQQIRDPQAEIYLDKLAELFKDDQAFQVEFKYEFVSRVENTSVSDYGSVIMKGEKYKLKTEDTEVYYNGEKLWSYSVFSEEVYITEPSPENSEQMLTDPFRLMHNYKEYYKYKLTGEKEVNGETYAEVQLYPINRNTSYSILKILIDKDSFQPYSFTLQQKNGYDINVFVTDIIRNLQVNDDVFTWNSKEHPDVLEIEM